MMQINRRLARPTAAAARCPRHISYHPLDPRLNPISVITISRLHYRPLSNVWAGVTSSRSRRRRRRQDVVESSLIYHTHTYTHMYHQVVYASRRFREARSKNMGKIINVKHFRGIPSYRDLRLFPRPRLCAPTNMYETNSTNGS